jgi:hypothetical protein
MKTDGKASGMFTLYALVAALTLGGVLGFAMDKPEASQIENRPLEKAPAFSAGALADGTFTDGVSTWYADTFPGRERMIEASSAFKALFGTTGAGADDVSIHYGVGTADGQDDAPTANGAAADSGTDGDDPSALPASDPESVAAAPDGADAAQASSGAAAGPETASGSGAAPGDGAAPAPSEAEDRGGDLSGAETREGGVIVIGDTGLEFYGFVEEVNTRYAGIIDAFADKYRGRIRTSVLVAPTSIEFKLPEKYAELTDDQRHAINYIYEHLSTDITMVDIYDTMKKHADEYIYFRTDHHWTQLGAYYAYRDYCAALGLPHTPLLSYARVRLDGFLGSFYNSIGGNTAMKERPDFVLAYAPIVPYEATGYFDAAMEDGFRLSLVRGPDEIQAANKYLAFSGGDLPVVDILMPQNQTGRRLAVFKESYANAFIPFLTENYDEILVVDFRYYDRNVDALLESRQINEALFLDYVSAAGSEKQVERLAALFE